MNRVVLVTLSILIASCGGGGGGGAVAIPPVVTPPPADTGAADALAAQLRGLDLERFYDVSFGALLSRSPETIVWEALSDTYPQDDVALDSLADAYQRETIDMQAVVLDALRGYDRAALSPQAQLDYDIYEWYLQDAIDRKPFVYHDFKATYSLIGVQRETERFFTDIHPLTTPAEAEQYIQRLGQVGTKFAQLSAHLTRQRDAGIVEPALTLQASLNAVSSIAGLSADAHPYFARFRNALPAIDELSEAQRQDLLNRARTATVESVIPGYRELQRTLQMLLPEAPSSIGVGQYPDGLAYYANRLRHHTTSDLGAAEIHQLGLDELARVHAEMRVIFDQLGYPQDETLQQLFARVRDDGGVVRAAETLETYTALIVAAEARLGEAFDILPPAEVIVLPDRSGGFYIGPSFDGRRPGAFYAGTETDQPWFQMPSLTYHESVPGHHLQISLAMVQEVPNFRKLVRFTGFVEGWALYAERLASELGWYGNDPYADLGRLQYEALRAARLVMDTGIHYYGWSFEQAVQFNVDNVGTSTGSSRGAAGRYSVWPGQATAYMVGMLRILEVRERARNELGDRFDLRQFHTALLSAGAVPLSLLDRVVDAYIAERLAQP
jgi:uncharacterized protein (DUF885 family)